MASREKHALRSHKTYGSNNVTFSKFEVRASKIKNADQLKSQTAIPIIEKLKNMFKYQDR